MGVAPFAPIEESGCQHLGWAVAHLPRYPPDRHEAGDSANPDRSDGAHDHHGPADAS